MKQSTTTNLSSWWRANSCITLLSLGLLPYRPSVHDILLCKFIPPFLSPTLLTASILHQTMSLYHSDSNGKIWYENVLSVKPLEPIFGHLGTLHCRTLRVGTQALCSWCTFGALVTLLHISQSNHRLCPSPPHLLLDNPCPKLLTGELRWVQYVPLKSDN